MHKRQIYALGCAYVIVALAFTGYVMLDAFVIERAYATVEDVTQAQEAIGTLAVRSCCFRL